MKKSSLPLLFFLAVVALPITLFSLLQQQDTRSKAASTTVQPGGSISSAINAANPGDVITVAAGTYNEALNITKSGSAGNYITVQAAPGGKVITNGTLKISGDYIKLIGITVKGSSGLGAEVNGADNIVLQNFEIDGSQDGGLVILSSSNIVVDGCNIHGTNARGTSANHEALSITEATTNFEIKNCQVHDNGEEGIDAKYNGSGNANGLIHDNVVFNNRGPNIYIDGAHGIKVYNNIVYGAKEGSKAGIAIAAETSYTGANNPRTAGNIDIFNNVVYNNAGGGISFWTESGGSISDVRIYNNTLDEAKPLAVATAPGGSNPVFNNIFTSNASGAGLQMGNNLTGAGGFVGGGDYHLVAGSPAIDKGTAAGSPAFDKDNKTRPAGSGVDMGAYEFGSTGGPIPSTVANPTVPLSPAPTGVTPTIYCVGGVGAPPCAPLSPGASVAPTGGSGSITPGTTTPPVGGTNPTTNPVPTISPCPTESSASVMHNNKKKKYKHRKGNRGGFLEQFLRFLFKFIEWFFQRLGIPMPDYPDPGEPTPEPCPEPTNPEAPTSAPQPTSGVEPSAVPSVNVSPTIGATPTIFGEPTTNPSPVPTTAGPVTGQILWQDAPASPVGKTHPLQNWDNAPWNIYARSTVTVVSDPIKGKAIRFFGPANGSNGDNQRGEIVPNFKFKGGENVWIAFDLWVDEPLGMARAHQQVWQFKSAPSEGSPTFAVNINNHKEGLVFGNDGALIAPTPYNKWIRMVYGVNATKGGTSSIEIWVDGKQVMPRTNQSALVRSGDSQGYLKFGVYRAPKPYDMSMRMANFKIGTTKEIVQ